MKKIYLFLFLCVASYMVNAQISLPPIIGDHMVLQQQSKVKLWGRSGNGKKVQVTTGWDNKTYRTQSGPRGNWEVEVTTPVAGGTYSITITDGTPLTLHNILIGDVWYCSGQSNMEMPLKGMTASQPVTGANEAIATAVKNKKMRLFTVRFGPEGEGPDKPYTGKWEIVDAATAAGFSAIGYFFGQYLTDVLDIPVGMICSAKGGTRIEQWSAQTDLDTFASHELNSTTAGNSGLYRQLVKPLSNYNIKGILWYQGESNWQSNPSTYGAIFEKMITRWRTDWNNQELPFYFAEVAPMKQLASVQLREEQYRIARTVPHVAMASTIDVGEPECIHPAQKEIVARRLAWIALAKTYGQTGIRADNPSFRSCYRTADGKIHIEFNHAEYGFTPPRNNIEGFEIAGPDSLFVPVTAHAVYIRETGTNVIEIENTGIANPRYVRYGYYPWVKGSLYNTFDLPVLSFSAEIPGPTVFHTGDRWCAIGNSITHQGKYLETIYLYYLTRYPYETFDLFNCGAGGDTATGVLIRRIEGDILVHNPTIATIMLGINDIWWENSGLYPPEYYSHNLEAIIDQLEAANCRVILLTPSPYDYTVKSDEPVDPKRLGLERLAGEVKEIAQKRNLPVVDFYNPLLRLTLEQQQTDPTFTLLVKDRVHTKPIADFLMGYTFIQQTTPSSEVSHLAIDAATQTITRQTNCSVNELAGNQETLRFTIVANALPFPLSAIPPGADGFTGFNNERNREILQINGLAPGQYTLYIDDTAIGNYTATEFSNGINLALQSNTPQARQAETLATTIAEYTTAVANTRYIAMIEYGELNKRYLSLIHVSEPTRRRG
ncbi:MAG: GDSL-type esterase/lipase family protein, partial [Tannerellaceae bacterium]|nr:GDSL-type esterase/lipase family protein [Tannerellaceae bacterium]